MSYVSMRWNGANRIIIVHFNTLFFYIKIFLTIQLNQWSLFIRDYGKLIIAYCVGKSYIELSWSKSIIIIVEDYKSCASLEQHNPFINSSFIATSIILNKFIISALVLLSIIYLLQVALEQTNQSINSKSVSSYIGATESFY